MKAWPSKRSTKHEALLGDLGEGRPGASRKAGPTEPPAGLGSPDQLLEADGTCIQIPVWTLTVWLLVSDPASVDLSVHRVDPIGLVEYLFVEWRHMDNTLRALIGGTDCIPSSAPWERDSMSSVFPFAEWAQ